MSSLALDAEALYGELQRGVRPLLTPETRLVGIVSGGQWLAERLQADLGLPGAAGAISSAMHRDDYAKRGLAARDNAHQPRLGRQQGAHAALQFAIQRLGVKRQ